MPTKPTENPASHRQRQPSRHNPVVGIMLQASPPGARTPPDDRDNFRRSQNRHTTQSPSTATLSNLPQTDAHRCLKTGQADDDDRGRPIPSLPTARRSTGCTRSHHNDGTAPTGWAGSTSPPNATSTIWGNAWTCSLTSLKSAWTFDATRSRKAWTFASTQPWPTFVPTWQSRVGGCMPWSSQRSSLPPAFSLRSRCSGPTDPQCPKPSRSADVDRTVGDVVRPHTT